MNAPSIDRQTMNRFFLLCSTAILLPAMPLACDGQPFSKQSNKDHGSSQPVPEYQGDRRSVSRELFIPRKLDREKIPGSIALEIPVEEGVQIGARYFTAPRPRDSSASDDAIGHRQPVFLAFHGNGETVDDYAFFARDFHSIGADLFVVDYRGYGWSDGTPTPRNMNRDALMIADFFLEYMDRIGHTGPRYLFGRSLGSVPASRVALKRPEAFSGLVLESAIAHGLPLMQRLGIDPRYHKYAESLTNTHILEDIEMPVLLLHGKNDALIPPAHAKENFAALLSLNARQKHLELIPEAGHSNIMVYRDRYYGAIRRFMNRTMTTDRSK